MGRAILAVIVGYLVIFAVVFMTFSIAYVAMGASGAFKAGSYDVSTTWVAASLVLGFLAALCGGYVCAAIAQRTKPVKVLAGLVLVLGLLMAIPVAMQAKSEVGARTADVGNLEAMQKAQQPTWLAFVNPIVGAAGVMMGAKRRGALS